MYHRYLNNTGVQQQYLLPNEDFTKVSDFSLAPNSIVTLGYPGLDIFIPHKLVKITEDGEDISHKVIRDRTPIFNIHSPLVVESVPKVVEEPVNIVVVEREDSAAVVEDELIIVVSPTVESDIIADSTADVSKIKSKKVKNKD